MIQGFTKAEKTIGAVAVATILVFFAFFTLLNRKSNTTVNFETETGINYKMARPEQAFAEYTLEGRELDSIYESLNPEQKKDFIKRKKELIAKKQEDIKKKEDAKKKSSAIGKSTNSQDRAQQTKSKVQQALVQKENDRRKLKSISSTPAKEQAAAVYSTSISNNDAPVNEEIKPKAKKSYADWRNLIFSAPTNENMTQFIQAHKKNEVSATEFQAMAQDLLDQEDTKLKGLGLLALRSVPSLASLSQLVHEQASLPAAYQAYVEQALISYFYPQNLGYFKAALATQDRILQAKVLTLLQTNLTRLSQGDQTVFIEARNSRSGEVSTLSMSSFISLLPILNTLNTSPDTELAQMSQQVATLIQTHNNIAQN